MKKRYRKPNFVAQRARWLMALCCSMVLVHTAQANECVDGFKAAYKSKDLKALSVAFNHRPSPDPCSEKQLSVLRSRATQLVADKASALFNKSESNADKASALIYGKGEATFRLASVWQINAVLGDIAHKKKDWAEAASQYNTAYELSLGSPPGVSVERKPASVERQKFLFSLASESMKLAQELTLAMNSRGEASGIYSSRGPKVKIRPIPLEFESGKSNLTQISLDAIPSIAAYIKQNNLSQLTVVGHTDWKGKDKFNQWLSEQRANTVATALKKELGKGNEGKVPKITSVGKGESCPRVVSDLGRYSESEAATLYRRVEFLWNSDASSNLDECDKDGIRG